MVACTDRFKTLELIFCPQCINQFGPVAASHRTELIQNNVFN